MTMPSPLSAQDGSLLLYCLGVRRPEWEGIDRPMLTDSDWAEIFRQAGGNGVTSLLYHRLRRHRPLVPIPPVALEHLWDASVRSAAQSLRLGRELAQVLTALRHHRVPVVVLKGAHLGQLVYPSAALRTMCDIDVLVGREDLTRAAAILSGLGYALQYYNVEEVDYTQHHHLRPMARPNGVRVEIHWAIAQPALPFAIDVKGLWERARPAEIAGAEVLVLSPEDLLLHLCLHASFTHGFRVGLRACWDILETVNHYGQAIDWDLVVRRAQAWGIGRYVYLTLRLVRDLLGAGIPPTAVAALEPPGFPSEVVAWATTCIFMPESDELVTASLARLSTSRPIGAKLAVLRHILYPPRSVMARIYDVPVHSRWIYLYYPMRWADLLRRYGRHAWGLWRGDHRTRGELRAVSERTALADWLRLAP